MPYQNNRGWTLFENIHQGEMKKSPIKKPIKIPDTFLLLKHQPASFIRRTIGSSPSTESTSQMLRLPMQPRMAGWQKMGFSIFSQRSDIQQKLFKEKLKITDGVARKLMATSIHYRSLDNKVLLS